MLLNNYSEISKDLELATKSYVYEKYNKELKDYVSKNHKYSN